MGSMADSGCLGQVAQCSSEKALSSCFGCADSLAGGGSQHVGQEREN